MPPIKVHSVTYQRNGIMGAGFYAIRFDATIDKQRRFIGFVYPEPEQEDGSTPFPRHYGMVDVDEPDACWRGDHFADDLWAVCQDYDRRLQTRLAAANRVHLRLVEG